MEEGNEVPDEQDTGNIYVGETLNGKKNGYGKLTFKYGVYEGEWESDMMSGNGRLELKSGNVYEGTFLGNRFHGEGVLRWKSGKVYEGKMRNGTMCGTGKLTSVEGVYEGDFFDNECFGRGTMTYVNGDVFTGDWRLGMIWGEGQLVTAEGNTYEGSFYKNQKHGKILRTDPKNNVYSERYTRDDLVVSYKLKKSKSSKSVSKFLAKITNKEKADSLNLFNRPTSTKDDVAKQLDKRAKNNSWHKGIFNRKGDKPPKEETSASKYSPSESTEWDPDTPGMVSPLAKQLSGDALSISNQASSTCLSNSPPESSPISQSLGKPPPLPPCPPPPSDHFSSLRKHSNGSKS